MHGEPDTHLFKEVPRGLMGMWTVTYPLFDLMSISSLATLSKADHKAQEKDYTKKNAIPMNWDIHNALS